MPSFHVKAGESAESLLMHDSGFRFRVPRGTLVLGFFSLWFKQIGVALGQENATLFLVLSNTCDKKIQQM